MAETKNTSTIATTTPPASPGLVADMIIGGVAGVAEVSVNQPLIYFKNSVQTGAKIASNPAVWYRGYLTNAGSLAPITAIQVAATSQIFTLLFAKPGHTTPTPVEKTISAVSAGALSGLVSGPSEAIILHQQRTGMGTMDAFKAIYTAKGLRGVFRGTPYAMFRDGLFTAGYMAGGPLLTHKFRDELGMSEATARLASGCTAGALAAVLTHPADTIKTRLQRDYMGEQYKSFSAPYREGGLFKGLAARSVRVIVGVCVISNVTEILQSKWSSITKMVTGNAAK